MDQDTKKMTRTAIYVAAGGYLLYLAYQLFGRLSESTGLSYTVSMAAMVLFAAGGAGIMIFGIRQLILLAKNGVSEFDKQQGPSEQDLSENVSPENEDNSAKIRNIHKPRSYIGRKWVQRSLSHRINVETRDFYMAETGIYKYAAPSGRDGAASGAPDGGADTPSDRRCTDPHHL